AASAGIAALQVAQPGPPNPTIPIRGFLFYIPWLLGRIAASNLRTMVLVLHPRMPIQPKIIRYPLKLRDPAAVSLLANSITLTPGTVTVEVKPKEILFHTLDDACAEDITSGRFEEKVRRVFEGKEGA
ncbi:MAG TPA: Na+/H+ antiporter subunit E, partial [Nitrospiria bacterium]|nr:Na+/H+ antiporter subunit E [Nitrospiria bacterium]